MNKDIKDAKCKNCRKYETKIRRFYLRKDWEIKTILEIIFSIEKNDNWDFVEIKEQKKEESDEIFYELFLERIVNNYKLI